MSPVDGPEPVCSSRWCTYCARRRAREEQERRARERAQRLCHYCPELGGTVDHIVPVSKGGLNRAWNKVRACRTCNEAKGSKWTTCTCAKCLEAIARWANGERKELTK